MLDLSDIRRDPEKYRRGIARKGSTEAIDRLLGIEARRRTLVQEAEALRARQNAANEGIARAKKEGRDASAVLEEMKGVKAEEREATARLKACEEEMEREVRLLPNPPDDDVPDGKSSEGNPVLSEWGTRPEFGFAPEPHWEIGARLGILDPEAAGRMSGSGFTVLKGDGALLERALGQFLLDLATRFHGYV